MSLRVFTCKTFLKANFTPSRSFQNAPEKSFVARRRGVEERSVHEVHEYRRTPQPTTPQAILTSILLRPGSACILTLLQRSLCRKLTIRIVNANLHFVIIFLAFLAASIGVRSRLFRDGCLVACSFLRRTIETVFHRIACIFELADDLLVLLVEARRYLDVLLRILRGAVFFIEIFSFQKQFPNGRAGAKAFFFRMFCGIFFIIWATL